MKKTLYLLVFFAGFWSLFSCQPSSSDKVKSSRKTIVCGKVVNQTPETAKVVVVIACDPLNDEDRHAVRLDSTGNFRVEFEMLWGHSFTINYAKKFINAYADSGDSIYIEIDAKAFQHNPKAVVFGGDYYKENKEFNQAYIDLIPKTYSIAFDDLTIPSDDFVKIFEQEVTKLNDTIDRYCKENKMSDWTKSIMKNMMLYSLANSAIDYKGTSPNDALNFFGHPIFDIYNNDSFKNMMFSYHVLAYFHKLIAADTALLKNLKDKAFDKAEKQWLEKMSKQPKSLTRDFLLFCFYKRTDLDTKNLSRDMFYNQQVFDKIEVPKTSDKPLATPEIQNAKGVSFMTQAGKIESISDFNFRKLIEGKYKGKVVYLDVWATWCGPCREEMAFARELHRLFKDRDVAFVSICMASSRPSWAKFIQEEKIEGDNYFFDEDLSLEASATMLHGGYPTYILFDKKGKMVTKNAPRPSALSAISEELERLLAE